MDSLETRAERLAALLRSDPDAAVRAVETAKIARKTRSTDSMDIIESIGGGIVAQVFAIGPKLWQVNVFPPLPEPEHPLRHQSREYVRDMLADHFVRNGWVLG